MSRAASTEVEVQSVVKKSAYALLDCPETCFKLYIKVQGG